MSRLEERVQSHSRPSPDPGSAPSSYQRGRRAVGWPIREAGTPALPVLHLPVSPAGCTPLPFYEPPLSLTGTVPRLLQGSRVGGRVSAGPSALVCLSLLPCARYSTGQDGQDTQLNAVRSDDALAHPRPSISSSCLPPSVPFTNHILTTHDLSCSLIYYCLPSRSTPLSLHTVPCIDCSAPPPTGPGPSPSPSQSLSLSQSPSQPRPGARDPLQRRHLTSLYSTVHTLESTPNLQPVCLAAAVLVASPDHHPDRHLR